MYRPSAPLSAAPILAAALLLGACGSPTPTPGRGMTFPASWTAATAIGARAGRAAGHRSRHGAGHRAADPAGPRAVPRPGHGVVPAAVPGVPLVGWSGDHRAHPEADLDGKVTRWSTYAVTGASTAGR